jgi:hypothetical protein
VSEEQALQHLDLQRRAGFARAADDPNIEPDRDTALDADVASVLMAGLRKLSSEDVHNPQALSADGMAVFNDLDWESTLRLIARSADIVRLVRDVPVGALGPAVAIFEPDLDPYLFILAAADDRELPIVTANTLALQKEGAEDRPQTPPIVVVYTLVGRPVITFMSAMLSMPKQSGQTTTAQTLQEIAR